MMSRLEQAMQKESVSEDSNFYQHVCGIFFENYLMDDFCNKVMRLLSMEQFHSETVREIYDSWMFERPLQFQSRIFSMLIHAGVIPAADCRDLAVKYYAPIYFFAQRWLFCGALSEKQKNAFRADAYDHIQKFFSGIGGKAE